MNEGGRRVLSLKPKRPGYERRRLVPAMSFGVCAAAMESRGSAVKDGVPLTSAIFPFSSERFACVFTFFAECFLCCHGVSVLNV